VIGIVITVVFAALWIRELARGRSLPSAPASVVPETRANRVREITPALATVKSDTQVSRNVFLELSTLGLGGVIGGLMTLPVLGFAIGPSFLKQGVASQDVGPLGLYPEGEYMITSFDSDPSQGEVSRVTAFIRNNGMLGKLPSFTILSSRCVHLGCPVEPNGTIGTATHYKDATLIPTQPSGFGCPCHDSQYDNEGNRTAGPAVRALDRYSFSIVNDHLLVGAPYSVAYVSGTGAEAKIHETTFAFAGEHVSGVESWLYPIQPPH